MQLRKDISLNELAETINVAQFVSFSPGIEPRQTFCRLLNYSPNYNFPDARTAITALLQTSVEQTVNIRCFRTDNDDIEELIYGVHLVDEVIEIVNNFSSNGYYTIVNETVDVHDGGVSGVIMGNVIEFAPDDTPLCVERSGVASMPRELGIEILINVYRFIPDIDIEHSMRLEFSIHPRRRGWLDKNTLGWDYRPIFTPTFSAKLEWPNTFSRFIGDKVFGLLVANNLGVRVPFTTVINRRIAPFTFGRRTGLADVWMRTCAAHTVPGRFISTHGWNDPFEIMNKEDPTGEEVPSIISQAAVLSEYSGAALMAVDGRLIIEGKKGEGRSFMQGCALPETLPSFVHHDVHVMFDYLYSTLGPVRFEWVHDGRDAWIVELHKGKTQSIQNVLYPGDARIWKEIDINKGVPKLQDILSEIKQGEGLLINGNIGLTSHKADVIRKAKIPSRIIS